jgi:DNA-binding NarL/FixJ family response regulator
MFSPAGVTFVSTVRILLVDDYPDFLDAAAIFLSTVPQFEIAGIARSGHEALEQVERLRPDLVLMDLVMPDMSGLEAARCIKVQAGAPRVVILTLSHAPAYFCAAQTAGADGVISKMEFGTDLIPLIHKFFD